MIPSTIRSRLFLLISVFGVAVTLLNVAFLWGLTKWVEDFIFDNLVRQEFARQETAGSSARPADHGAGQVFWSGSRMEDFPAAWRPWLASLGPGIHEEEEQLSLMAMVQPDAAGNLRYLVMDTARLEYVESNMATVVFYILLVLVLALAGAVVVSLYFARKIIDPLIQLTDRITAYDPAGPGTPPPAAGGADEISRLARAFAGLHQRLQAYIARERRFTSDVSHELRTPLAVSANALELLMADPVSERQNRYIERINRSIRRMESLVEAFLALAREENSRGAAPARCTLDSLVEESLEYQRMAYPHYQPGVEKLYGPDACLDGSPTLLDILLRNLIVNAVLYSPDRTVRIDGGPGWVRIRNRMHPQAAPAAGAGIGLSVAERVADALGLRFISTRSGDAFEALIQSDKGSNPPGKLTPKPATPP